MKKLLLLTLIISSIIIQTSQAPKDNDPKKDPEQQKIYARVLWDHHRPILLPYNLQTEQEEAKFLLEQEKAIRNQSQNKKSDTEKKQ